MRRYLGEQFGEPMKYIWAVGLFAAGQSSTMTGTYTGQFVMSGFMELHVSPFVRALITRSVALVPTLAFALAYAGTNEMDAVNQDLNVLQSFQLPFALVPVLYMCTREEVMGAFVTRRAFKWVVYAVSAALVLLNLWTAVAASASSIQSSVLAGTAIVAALLLYFGFVVYLLVGPVALQRVLDRTESPPLRLLLRIFARGADYEGLPQAQAGAMVAQGEYAAAPLSPSALVESRRSPDIDET